MILNVSKSTEFRHGTWVECPTDGPEVQGSSSCAGMKEITSIYVNNVLLSLRDLPREREWHGGDAQDGVLCPICGGSS